MAQWRNGSILLLREKRIEKLSNFQIFKLEKWTKEICVKQEPGWLPVTK